MHLKHRKLIHFFGLFFLLACALAGCGGGSVESVSPTAEAVAVAGTPVVNIVTNPVDVEEVLPGQQVIISIEASGSNLQFEWQEDKGTLSRTDGVSAIYTAPEAPGPDNVDITISSDGGSTTKTIAFVVLEPTLTPTSTLPPTETATEVAVTDTPEPPVTPTPTVIAHDTACDNFTAVPVVTRPLLGSSELAGNITTPAHCITGIAAGVPVGTGGEADDVAEGVFLWLLAYTRSARYYPQCDDASQGECSANPVRNRWTVTTFLGRPECKEHFHLVLVETDSAGNDFLVNTMKSWAEAEDFPGLTPSELPDHIAELDAIEVETAGTEEGCS